MPRLEVFAATFAAMLMAELGDKTQLIGFALAAGGKPFTAFLAASTGFIAANLLTAPLGLLLRGYFEPYLLKAAVGTLFAAVGLLTLLKKEEERFLGNCSFTKGFCLMFLAELGDKTNLTAVALTASTGSLAEVALGIAAAGITLMAMATALGSVIARRLPLALVRNVVGLLFIAIGILMLIIP